MKTARRLLCLAAAVSAVMAPAAAAEIQRPHEEVIVAFPADDGFNVYARFHPQKRVAVFGAESTAVDRSGVWSSTSYAKRMPRRSFGKVVHLDFGPLGRIDGRFVAEGSPRVGRLSRFCRGRRPVSEFGRFVGKIVFRGDGGWLVASTRRAPVAVVSRTFRLRCEKGHAAEFENPRPGLFGYVQAPTEFLSNNDGTYLHSILRGENVVTEFMALDHFRGGAVGFKAVAREWLPGDVATTRSVEVEEAAESTFGLGEPKRRPRTASAHPPLPFSGAAEYTRSLGFLDGDLTASFLGRDLPLAGPSSVVEICARPRQAKLWDCG